MADAPKKSFFLFDTSDDNQLGPFVIAVLATILIFLIAIIGGHGHLP